MTNLAVRNETSPPRRAGRGAARRRAIVRMVGRRLLFFVPVLAVVSAAVFAAAAASPFDPLVGYLGARYVTTSETDKALIAEELGFDRPWYSAYGDWLSAVSSGDLGMSRTFDQPVAQVVSERLPWTLLLTAVGLTAAIVLSLAIGTWSGMHRGGRIDRIVSAICVVVQSLPPFVLALGTVAVLAVATGWFPVAGLTDAGADPTVGQVLRHLALPAGVLALSQMPWLLLAVRESVSSARGEDFVAGAVARGIPPSLVTRRHILPTSLAPFVTIIGVRLPEILVGAVLVEEVFSWPGLASAVVESARNLDMSLLAVLTVGTVLLVMAGSLLTDVVYAALDPRVSTDG